MRMQVKAIAFDLWNTIAFSKKERFLEKARDHFGLSEKEFNKGRYWTFAEEHWMKGRKSEKEFFKELCEYLGLTNGDAVKEFILLWEENLDSFKFFPESENVLSILSRKYPLALISNTEESSGERARKRFHLERFFKEVVYSYEVGLVKPDKRVFDITAKRIGFKPSEMCMIGDDTKNDIKGAKSVGMKAIWINRENSGTCVEADYTLKNLIELKEIFL
ncbi:HAD family hydrolase [Candidatus Micrarchaeota archaeon]|nr:HAD family hydrolase [Candidatus Micrarchaeota archaeon]